MTFNPGDKVIRDPAGWVSSDFDAWGAGVGVGVVVEPPTSVGPSFVDVRWPSGRCFQLVSELLPADDPSATVIRLRCNTDPGGR